MVKNSEASLSGWVGGRDHLFSLPCAHAKAIENAAKTGWLMHVRSEELHSGFWRKCEIHKATEVVLSMWNLDHTLTAGLRSIWKPNLLQVVLICFWHWVSDMGRMAIKLTSVPTRHCWRGKKAGRQSSRAGQACQVKARLKLNRQTQQVVKLWTKAELLQTAFCGGKRGLFCR